MPTVLESDTFKERTNAQSTDFSLALVVISLNEIQSLILDINLFFCLIEDFLSR